jgi:hypothetical protein
MRQGDVGIARSELGPALCYQLDPLANNGFLPQRVGNTVSDCWQACWRVHHSAVAYTRSVIIFPTRVTSLRTHTQPSSRLPRPIIVTPDKQVHRNRALRARARDEGDEQFSPRDRFLQTTLFTMASPQASASVRASPAPARKVALYQHDNRRCNIVQPGGRKCREGVIAHD